MDLFTRRVVDWAFSPHPAAALKITPLDVPYEQRGEPIGVMFDSDQDGLYARRNFHQRLWRYPM